MSINSFPVHDIRCTITVLSKQLSAVALISFQWYEVVFIAQLSPLLSVYWLFRPSDFEAAVVNSNHYNMNPSHEHFGYSLKLVSATLH